MQFIDRVKLHLKAGDGGDGLVAFRHEKYVPFGGPSGGDGGDGGSIIFKADRNLNTLLDLRYKHKIVARDGERGKNNNMFGKNGEDIIIKVPVGTIVKRTADGLILADFLEDGQTEIICKGGRGGKGNRHYASSKNTAPEHAQMGSEGQEFDAEIELKLLADVGLVGLPSVGKSTLLSVVSSARPMIADYPFTTLKPQLGMVKVDDSFSFVMADLPGLIEGASLGKGLGHDFLKHLERCRLLVHVLDMSHDDPINDFNIINAELANYPSALDKRIQLVLANKMDVDGALENLNKFKKEFSHLKIFPASTLLQEGIKPLLYAIKELLPDIAPYPLYDEKNKDYKIYEYQETNDFKINKNGPKSFTVISIKAEKYLKQLDLHNESDALRFSRFLTKIGIDDALRKAGARDGDEITIGQITFIFDDNTSF